MGVVWNLLVFYWPVNTWAVGRRGKVWDLLVEPMDRKGSSELRRKVDMEAQDFSLSVPKPSCGPENIMPYTQTHYQGGCGRSLLVNIQSTTKN